MSLHSKVFFFLLLIPICVLVCAIRASLIDMREGQRELFLLNAQRASQQRVIMGLEIRILHYSEKHGDEKIIGCPLCFKNIMMEGYDHKLIRKFLSENDPKKHYEGVYGQEDTRTDK